SAGVGQGATFVVALPSVRPSASASAASNGPAATRVAAGYRVLLVEDNADNAAAIAELLRMHGHEVRVANSVAEGLRLGREGFDVLVSDIGLPEGTGRDLMRQLRERQAVAVKGIALTGYGMSRDIADDEDAGFTRHLTKPVEPAILLEAIAELAGG